MPYKDLEKRRQWERTHKKKYRQENPEVGFKTAMSVWKRKPTRAYARQVVYYAIKTGRLIKSTSCERCGRKECVIEAHHLSYDDPLKVEWLCKSCHRVADRERQQRDGEAPSNMRKLADEQVREIRSSDKTDRELASIYGMSSCSINKVRNRLTYKDVSDR